jgi:hypothetical protein
VHFPRPIISFNLGHLSRLVHEVTSIPHDSINRDLLGRAFGTGHVMIEHFNCIVPVNKKKKEKKGGGVLYGGHPLMRKLERRSLGVVTQMKRSTAVCPDLPQTFSTPYLLCEWSGG